jgi:4-hydroxymandelate oxidase
VDNRNTPLAGANPPADATGTPRTLPRLSDYAEHARATMPMALFGRLFGAEGDAIWLSDQNNLAGFRKIDLRPSVLVDVRKRNLATGVLGQQIRLPVMLAPVGTHKWAHPAGELASVRAAGRAGTVMVVSTSSSFSLEEIAEQASGPVWFQLYYFPDRGLTEALVRRAEAAGYSALVLTVDFANAPVEQRRDDRIVWNMADIEAPAAHGNFADFDTGGPLLKAAWHESGVTWSDLEWLCSISTLPVVVKGIQIGEDAARCVEAGVAGIVVSNHGGRALEDAAATVRQLPEVVAAVSGRVEVYLDGGVRKGIDVLKALAIGARAVLIGRPILWGLAANGEDGVFDVLEALRTELDMAMALCGVRDASSVERRLITAPTSWE